MASAGAMDCGVRLLHSGSATTTLVRLNLLEIRPYSLGPPAHERSFLVSSLGLRVV
jgi:hypothetical protein